MEGDRGQRFSSLSAESPEARALPSPLGGAPEWLSGFQELSAASLYVARPETERALRELLRSIAKPGRPAALVGPPGLGKTLLLQLAAHRTRQKLHCVMLPYGAVDAEDLAEWILGRLGDVPAMASKIKAHAGQVAPSARLRALLRALRKSRQAILLLIDDAGGMPLSTARILGRWVETSRGGLRLVLATCDDSAGSRVVAALGRSVTRVRLNSPMSLRETADYVEARLSRGNAPQSVLDRADAELLGRIHRLSAGVPRLVERMAAWELCDLPPGVRVPWGEDGLLDLADAEPDPAAADDLDDLGEELSPDLPPVLADDRNAR